MKRAQPTRLSKVACLPLGSSSDRSAWVRPNWSAKAEYLYTEISGNNQNTWFNPGIGLNNVNNRTRFHTVRAGINYHFNFGAPAPVLAAY